MKIKAGLQWLDKWHSLMTQYVLPIKLNAWYILRI